MNIFFSLSKSLNILKEIKTCLAKEAILLSHKVVYVLSLLTQAIENCMYKRYSL